METKSAPVKNKRFIKNLLIRPERQLKLATLMIVSSYLLVLGAFLGTQIFNYFTIKTSLSSEAIDPIIYEHILNSLMQSMLYPTLLCLLLILVSFVFLVKISHRFFGPIVPITAILDKLIQGDYGHTRNLRDGDELTEVMDAVNSLSKALKERHGSSSK
ncbi:MAG: hypothetical protein K2Q26_14110 [Bdellovibrionales bacterium]|nr:hypothetical protein [Bdellovibrionales bacterium]